jgi:hypothetical protein
MITDTLAKHILTAVEDIPIVNFNLTSCAGMYKIRGRTHEDVTFDELRSILTDITMYKAETVRVLPNGVVIDGKNGERLAEPATFNVHVHLDGAVCDVYDAMPILQEAMEDGMLVDVQ